MLMGTPDADGDAVPGMWAAASGGRLCFWPGGRTAHGARFMVGDTGVTNRAIG
ncbi:hypothetical protein [Streptomyces sp. NPDC004284]|uniref:hypothetical protein n=1 Tax=Streptomyces sp. NPDC004284 TaxID=3364695 RepID=UPI0036ACD4FC